MATATCLQSTFQHMKGHSEACVQCLCSSTMRCCAGCTARQPAPTTAPACRTLRWARMLACPRGQLQVASVLLHGWQFANPFQGTEEGQACVVVSRWKMHTGRFISFASGAQHPGHQNWNTLLGHRAAGAGSVSWMGAHCPGTHRALCRALAAAVAAGGAHLAVHSGGHHVAIHAVDQVASDGVGVAE